jgi:hypothetical protein
MSVFNLSTFQYFGGTPQYNRRITHNSKNVSYLHPFGKSILEKY